MTWSCVRLGSPRRLRSANGEQVLDAVRNPVQRAAITPGADLGVGLLRRFASLSFENRHRAQQRGIESLEAIEVDLGQLDRRRSSATAAALPDDARAGTRVPLLTSARDPFQPSTVKRDALERLTSALTRDLLEVRTGATGIRLEDHRRWFAVAERSWWRRRCGLLPATAPCAVRLDGSPVSAAVMSAPRTKLRRSTPRFSSGLAASDVMSVSSVVLMVAPRAHGDCRLA